ncbi:MAG: threonylcarbamoyl-AMP synthase [Nitrospira sp.]|nr:threonylcarbamoyl-AMP synthase [bacterium]MBL7048684.1 threonylcarbamoyl-AMP synthase [Nitrospira sp.]
MVKLCMSVIKYTKDGAGALLRQACAVLNNGGIVAYPTESFYALGVCALKEEALNRLYELKKRPYEKPLPLIVDTEETLQRIARVVPKEAREYMGKYWPGPLTIIFEAFEGISTMLTAGTGSIAVRIPGEGPALQLVRSIKEPLTATSANPSSLPPADSAEMVRSYFGDTIDMVIDGGMTSGGLPSTIIDLRSGILKVLRQGRVEL